MNGIEERTVDSQVRNLKARYCRMIDTHSWPEVSRLFAEDAILDIGGDIKSGVAESKIAGRTTIVARIRSLIGEAMTVHQVHEPEIQIFDSEHAAAIWPMEDFIIWPDGVAAPFPARRMRGYGWYHDKYVLTAEGWQIAELRLVRQHIEFG
jgi:hypothetical protein